MERLFFRLLLFIVQSLTAVTPVCGVVLSAPKLRESHNTVVATTSAPPIDIGYGIYQGYYNDTSQLNIYKGY